jgi:peptidyl carrier protein
MSMAHPKLSEQDLVDKILDHLRTRVLNGDPLGELTDTTPLLGYRLLNSIRTAELLAFIKDDLGIDIDGLELTGATMATARDLGRALTGLGSGPGRE